MIQKMKNLSKYISLAFLPLLISSCNDYLDPNEYSVRGEEQIFNTTTYVNNLSAAIYSCIPDARQI
jgi:PBP1b-binding outer membrane lipoprotein LpoB